MTAKEYLNYIEKEDLLQTQYLQTIGLLLLSIRGDWSDARSVKDRSKAALCLCDMIEKNCLFLSNEKTEEGKFFISELERTIEDYLQGITSAENPKGPFHEDLGVAIDGRYFRDNFPYGYYGICPSDFGQIDEE